MKAAAEPSGPLALPNTRWSVILDAQQENPAALAEFCREYWFPLYGYARRTGLGPEDAADLTQAFFERILSRDVLGQARRERGRLRNFLLRTFHNFAAEEWRRTHSQRRGTPGTVVALDALSVEPRSHVTPETEYERSWAREVLRQARERLRTLYQQLGQQTMFHALEGFLTDGDLEGSFREIAAPLGITEAAARFAAFQLRRRYRETLREVVADTVASPEEVSAELEHLQSLFGR
ncbi:MAG: sigma-70 family RNA polymerase sigma factor [Verrucomicrobia bacterium]|nr:sigma-70 family RNA polymerase sigma factor [Verrucomicrobiota bacterium]